MKPARQWRTDGPNEYRLIDSRGILGYAGWSPRPPAGGYYARTEQEHAPTYFETLEESKTYVETNARH